MTASMIAACGDSGGSDGGDETAGSETATDTAGTEDEIGESGTTTTTTSDDTTSTTTEEEEESTSDDNSCPIGSEGCPCTGGGGCDPGLMCMDGVCSPPAPDTTGPDTSTETTETDTGSPLCDMDVSIEVAAIDATDADGWEPSMSMLGEGMIMAWDQQTMDAFISFDLDIPCDGTWHVWVRGIDQGQNDSYFAIVDGEPNPPAIFELDCTAGPNQAEYLWKELNWRDQADPACTYLQDPWTHDWLTGVHNLTIGYRESGAISRIWVTNTDQPPP